MTIHLVTIQDKSLYGEPDVAIAVVAAYDDGAAQRSADATIVQLAESGRGRCVPHARAIDLGRFYRLGALVRLPPSDGDVPPPKFVEYARDPTQMLTVATSWPATTHGSIALFGDDGGPPLRGWAEPSQIPGRPSVCLRANGESSWMSPDDARKLAAMLIAAANGINAFDPSET